MFLAAFKTIVNRG